MTCGEIALWRVKTPLGRKTYLILPIQRVCDAVLGMGPILNQDLGFDEVRWGTLRKTSYDAKISFLNAPVKTRLGKGTRLYRLMRLAAGMYWDGVWWMPEDVFAQVRAVNNQATHGSGRLLRNLIAEGLALPNGKVQLSVAEIELKEDVFAWVGKASALFDRPGGMEQVFLPFLNDRVAKVVRTYGLQF